MDNSKPIISEKVIFWGLLILVLAVLAFAPLNYEFIYPSGGDDTANHITDLANLTENLDYEGRSITYYGITLLIPFTSLGLSSVTVFSIFSYAVILGVFASLWLLVRRFYGLLPAVLSFYVSVFITMGTWYYFEDGTIFSIFNLWVLGMLALYCLCSWLEGGGYRWLAGSGVLFILTSLVHSASYLFIMASILLFVAGYSIYKYVKKDKTMLLRTIKFGLVFLLSIISAWVTWMHDLLPRLTDAMVSTITGGETSYVPIITPGSWTTHYLNIGIVFLIALGIFILVMILRKGDREDKESIVSKFNQPLSYIILSFLIVLSIGAFTLLGYNYDRFARELGTFVGLGTAVLLGVTFTYYRLRFKKALLVVLAFILLTVNVPLHNWLGDYTAVRNCDKQAIDYLNDIATSRIEVQHFATLAPWIYELYTDENVVFRRVYDLENYREADYVIFRNNHMTFYTENRARKDDIVIDEGALDQLDSLVRVGEVHSGADILIIYQKIS